MTRTREMQEMGIESSLVQYIQAGKKTIEGRLNTGKFALMKVGDHISIREDIYTPGQDVVSVSEACVVRLTRIRAYATFDAMLQDVGYQHCIPSAQSRKEALAVYQRFYSDIQQLDHGVVALEFKLIR